MTFDQIFSQLHLAKEPIEKLAELRTQPYNNKDIKVAINALKDAISRNRSGRALSAGRALLVLAGPNKAIAQLKRHGVLRASRYDFDNGAINKLLSDWIAHAGDYGLCAGDAEFLVSAKSLCVIAPLVQKIYRKIVVQLHKHRHVAIKSLLAEVDATFSYPEPVDVGFEGTRPVTREELAEAFSFVLQVFHARVGMTSRQFNMTDVDIGYNTIFPSLLGDALKLCRYRDAEVLLEAFPFRADHSAEGVRITSLDPALERSIRIGYIQTAMQAHVIHHQLMHAKKAGLHHSFSDFANQFFEDLGNKVIRLKSSPVQRYVIEVPMYPPLMQLLMEDTASLEEISRFEALAWEEYIEPSAIPHSTIVDNITVLDLLKVQRLFRFLHLGLLKAIERHTPFCERAGLYRTSCLPVFTKERFHALLACVVGESKAPEIIQLITADLTDTNLDIQYTPVIRAGDHIMLSLAMLSTSDLPRNSLCKLRKRLVKPSPDHSDPMQLALARALRDVGFLVQEEINLTTGKNKLEVDLLAYREGHLFIFECKNAYHPCNIYEMRNTYDAILVAADQLKLRQEHLSDAANRHKLFDKIAWDVPKPIALHTCIALGNRVFNGYSCDGHPVRQTHEILNVLQHGYIEFMNGDRARLWEHNAFTTNDLIAHLEGFTTLTDMIESMIPVEHVTPIMQTQLIFSTYGIDYEQLEVTLNARYPKLA